MYLDDLDVNHQQLIRDDSWFISPPQVGTQSAMSFGVHQFLDSNHQPDELQVFLQIDNESLKLASTIRKTR